MYCVRVRNQLANRIDAEFYSPSALKAEEAVLSFRSHQAFGNLVSSGYRVVYHGVDPVSALVPADRLKFLAPSNVDESGAIEFSGCGEVPRYYSTRYPKGIGKPGELLIEVKGNVSKVTVLPCFLPTELMISGSFYKALLNKEFDAHFVLAFFKSSYGQVLKKRLASNSIIDYIAKGDLYSIPLPYPAAPVQAYIGDKIRQAERLRNVGASALNEATSLLENCLHWESKLAKSNRFRRLKVVELADRLDGNFNSPARLSMMDHLDGYGIRRDQLSPKLADVSAMIGWKGLTTEHYTDSGPWLLRGVEIVDGVIDFDALISVAQDKYDEQPQIHLQKGDVALSKDGTIGKAAVIPDLPQEMAVGSTVARLRLRDNSGIDPYYLEHALNHDVLQIQIRSFATGMAQPHITQEWIERLQVPRCVNENRIASLVKRHHTATAIAKDLALVARFLVEALIERHVSESDLITLQKALEGGDSQGERSLLSRMTRKGLDVKGAPVMFPNLDGLYQILTETELLVTAEAK